jgi:ceramide glucosyltransferase
MAGRADEVSVSIAAGLLLAIYSLLTAVRAGLSWRYLERHAELHTSPASFTDVTVLQPILSGDPALAACLSANLDQTPEARFLWLIDEDDLEARAIAETLAPPQRVTVVLAPPPSDGENPKVAKLARAFPLVETRYLAVLDDDTVLPRGGLARVISSLEPGGLATGLPLYASKANGWSRLVSGFVNGSALLTYPAASLVGAARTINGMFYVTEAAALAQAGGFEAIRGSLTDDYAIASLFRRLNAPIIQTDMLHPISTTVTGMRHYFGIMRRWMIFGSRYLRENFSLFSLVLVMVPTIVPPILLAVGLVAGWPWALGALALLLLKAQLNRLLRQRLGGPSGNAIDMLYEAAADLLTPFHIIFALVSPNRFNWRSRRIRMTDERISYE